MRSQQIASYTLTTADKFVRHLVSQKGANMKTKKQTVWVVEIQLNDSIMAIGTTEKIALRNCAARAVKYLDDRDCGINWDTGKKWTKPTLVEYFCYRATECELDGIGQIN